MIEIKSVSGRVLYTADAKNLRDAVEQAVGARAHLTGANLTGANPTDGTWQAVADILRASLLAMNDSGRHWIKGTLTQTLGDGTAAYCSIGSVEAQEGDGTARAVALWLLGSVCGGNIAEFNDHKGTTWEDVQAVFGVAARHAERFSGEAA